MRAPETSSARSRFPVTVAALLLMVAVAIAYANTLGAPFVFDDFPAIRDNPTIRALWPLSVPLSPPPETGIGGRPLSNFSFALNHALTGDTLWGYHLGNILLHAGSVLLLFGIVRRTPRLVRANGGADTAVAFAAALLWSIHPLATAAVTWLSQRTELLMAFMYLLTLYGFVRGVATAQRGWLAVSVVACLFGMVSKEVMATAPVVVLLYDRTFIAGTFRAAWTARRPYYLALAATWLVLGYLLTTGLNLRSVGFGLGVSPLQYAQAEVRAIIHYVRLALWPHPLVFDYGASYAAPPWQTMLCGLIVAVVVAVTVRGLRRPNAVAFWGAAFLLLLAPTSSFVPVAEQPVAENRMYLPLAVIIVGGVVAAAGWFRRRLAPSAASSFLPPAFVVLLAAAWLPATIARNRVYATEASLWEATVAQRPANPRARFNYGVALLDVHRAAEAAAEFRRAIALKPADPKSHNSLGNALLELGQPAEALPHFADAVRLQPGYGSAWYNYGTALLRTGDAAGAVQRLQRAAQLMPTSAEVQTALGNAWFQLNRPAEAIPHYRAALAIDASNADAQYNCGSACLELGQVDDAVAHFSAAARLKPGDPEIQNYLGAALLRGGRIDEAIVAFEAALRARPDDRDARDNLAVARREREKARAK